MIFNPNVHLITVAPHFIPEVLEKPSIGNPIAISLGAIAGFLSLYLGMIAAWLIKESGIICKINLTFRLGWE